MHLTYILILVIILLDLLETELAILLRKIKNKEFTVYYYSQVMSLTTHALFLL